MVNLEKLLSAMVISTMGMPVNNTHLAAAFDII